MPARMVNHKTIQIHFPAKLQEERKIKTQVP